MNLNEIDSFRRIVTQHFALYPSAAMTEATVSSWWDELQHLPIATLPTAFRTSREQSPQFPATAAQIKALAETEATKLAKRLEEKRQQRYLPPPADAVLPSLLEAFTMACDREARSVSEGKTTDEHEPAIVALVVALLRCYGMRNTPDSEQFGRWFWSDCKHRALDARAVIGGLRKAPELCGKPPTVGMLVAIVRGEDVRTWPGGRARGDAPEAPKEIDGRWQQLATYWGQENGYWEMHPDQRPADWSTKRWAQFWKMWKQTAGSGSSGQSVTSSPSSGSAGEGASGEVAA